MMRVIHLFSLFISLACSSTLAVELDPAQYLDQNWTEAERQKFYYTPQGSHLMPYDWAMQLRSPRNQELFFKGRGLERYGYIAQSPSRENPDALPIGFTKDGLYNKNYLGMNCAACHTTNIQAGNANLRIDGGPTRADFQTFVADMDAASERTLDDPALFEIFARGVLARNYSAEEAAKLRVDFAAYVAERKEWQARNGSAMAYGPGRNDAFGVIFNQVLAHSLGLPANRREADAPVSYPVLWDTNQHDFVQWVGIASNAPDKGGSLSRNIGQVLGVFGHIDTARRTRILNGYCSSARRTNLDELEEISKKLWSPLWPEAVLGPVSSLPNAQARQAQLARGHEVYRQSCVHCHAEINRVDPERKITAVMVPIARVGTDPKTAQNAGGRTALTGALAGAQLELISGRALENEEPAGLVLRHVVAGALVGTISPITCSGEIDTSELTVLFSWKRVLRRAIGRLFDPGEAEPNLTLEQRVAAQRAATEKYKARPLNGVWASAPYLHNGSVKNLYEMLLPASLRSSKFRVGCNRFDAENVGFDCEGQSDTFEFDASLPGNSNQGHEYAANLSEEDRRALLAYLKSI